MGTGTDDLLALFEFTPLWKMKVSNYRLCNVTIKRIYCYIAGVFPATARHFIGYFMVTRHLTMKLFPAKCHARATLQKL